MLWPLKKRSIPIDHRVKQDHGLAFVFLQNAIQLFLVVPLTFLLATFVGNGKIPSAIRMAFVLFFSIATA